MKVAVYVNGLTEGFNTPGGTEAQYIYGLVKVLTRFGHTVDCFGTGSHEAQDPMWGSSSSLDNTRLLNFHTAPTEDSYDVYFNLPHNPRDIKGVTHPCTESRVESKINFHCQFAWYDTLETTVPVKCWKPPYNHLIALPWNIKQNSSNSSLRYIPFPYYDTFTSIDPTIRRGIFWGARNTFYDECKEDRDMQVYGAKLIKAMEIVSNKHDIPCYFLHGYTFKTKRAHRMGVARAVDNIKNKIVFDNLVPKDKVIELLSKCRVTPIPPDLMGSCVDAVVYGCQPIFYDTNPPFTDYCAEGFHYIRNMFQDKYTFMRTHSIKEIAEILEMICLDDNLYIDLIEQSRQGLSWHSYENSYKYIMELIT